MIGDLFDSEWYLHNNPDVAAVVRLGLTDAATHHHQHGRFEGRSPSHLFDPDHYLAKNPDVKAAVDAGLVTAYDHFLLHGQAEGRVFVPYLDVDFYLQRNPDVAIAVEGDPGGAVVHFLLHGHAEARPISPFFDMGAYLVANPDVAAAVEQFGASALQHLLFHGYGESRDLGNGIHLNQFANDPVFQSAKTPFEALARVAEVGPFLPTFIPPKGWEAPADTPIPIDFIPVPGEKLIIPPSVKIPDGMELPDTFEPVKPDPGPSPNPKPDPAPEPEGPFKAYVDDDGVIRFDNVRNKKVEFKSIGPDLEGEDELLAMLLEFQSEGQTSTVRLTLGCGCTESEPGFDPDLDPDELLDSLKLFEPYIHIELQADETLVAEPEFLLFTMVNKVQVFGASPAEEGGLVGIKVDMGEGQLAPETHLSFDNTVAFVLSDIRDGTEKLHLNMDESWVVLGPHSDYNLLTYGKASAGDPTVEIEPKSLKVQTAGSRNIIDLGNEDVYDIGYSLGDVEVTGSGLFFLFSLYLGEDGTTFDSSKHEGNVVLHAYVDTNYEHDPESTGDDGWNIHLGDGDDALLLTANGDEDGEGKTGGYIDGGGGTNLLGLDAELYDLWTAPGLKGGPVIKNFEILSTEAVEGRKYEPLLLEHEFKTLSIHNDGSDSPSVLVAEGFSTVVAAGNMTVDASALNGGAVDIYIKSLSDMTPYGEMELFEEMDLFGGGEASIKIADLEAALNDESDISIILSDRLDISTLTVENMRFSTGLDGQNNTIDISAWGLGDDTFMSKGLDFRVSAGADIMMGGDELHYMNFSIGFDLDEHEGVDFTLVLRNIMTQSEYTAMRAELMPEGDDLKLLGILVNEGFILA